MADIPEHLRGACYIQPGDPVPAGLRKLGDAPAASRPAEIAAMLDRAGTEVEVLKHFGFGDVKHPRMREVARHYGILAATTVVMCPDCAQRAIALQHLLEARDAAMRAAQ
jgi:hypothetical protein